jgi:hypothetical protein
MLILLDPGLIMDYFKLVFNMHILNNKSLHPAIDIITELHNCGLFKSICFIILMKKT